jgi:hypothetical protein
MIDIGYKKANNLEQGKIYYYNGHPINTKIHFFLVIEDHRTNAKILASDNYDNLLDKRIFKGVDQFRQDKLNEKFINRNSDYELLSPYTQFYLKSSLEVTDIDKFPFRLENIPIPVDMTATDRLEVKLLSEISKDG